MPTYIGWTFTQLLPQTDMAQCQGDDCEHTVLSRALFCAGRWVDKTRRQFQTEQCVIKKILVR